MKRMCNARHHLWLALVAVAIVATGCESTSGPDDAGDLGAELRAELKTASNGVGPSYFTMPESDDYSAIPQDPHNPITSEKVALGKLLYHETALLKKPKFEQGGLTGSCASCHHVDAGFQAGVPQGIGEGGMGFGLRGEARTRDPLCVIDSMDIQPIRSPSAMNVAWQPNILWNGQFGATAMNVGTESQWTVGTPKEKNTLGYEGLETQAIAGIGVHRLDVASSIVPTNSQYEAMFDAAFPDVPAGQRITNITAGLAIAAYERTLLANHSPFQRWLHGEESAMNEQQKRGALVFFDTKANCVSCHTGPALNSMAFYGLGMKNLDGPGVYGQDFTKPENKGRGGFTGRAEDMFKFKVPQLYNLTDSRFYGHGASMHSVREVIEYKNQGVAEDATVPATQIAAGFKPLGLTADQITDLVAFIEKGLYDPDLHRYVPTSIPSGQCFPNNDPQSRIDRGCN